MFDTDKILNAISNIDDEILYAEGAVTSSLCMFDDKIDQMKKFCTNEEFLTEYIQEASVGTGISYNKSDSLIKRIWTFIRRVVHTIINKISDLMTKLKIRKFEYVETPMSFDDIKSDMDDINNVFGGLTEVMISEYITNNNGTDRSKAINELKAFLKKINDLKIFKTKNDDKRHGVKPDEFMKLRDKLRFMNQQMKDMSKRTDSFIRDTEKTNAFSNKQYEQYCRMIQQVFAKMNEATTKLFSSFKFSAAKKVSAEDIMTTMNNTRETSNILNAIYKEIVGLEYSVIIETAQPFNEYLKKHEYDNKSNTIMHNGKRVKLPKVLSNKEINRANRFLRENNYDPKTETIETDVKSGDGKYERVKFDIDPTLVDNGELRGESNGWYPERDAEKIRMGIAGSFGISGKPIKSNNTFKHEEGHFVQRSKVRDSHLAAFDSVSDGKSVEEISKNIQDAVDIKNREGIDEDVFEAINNHHNTKYTKHDKPVEYDADLYALRHNRYASGKHADIAALRREMDRRKHDLEKRYGRSDEEIAKSAEAYVFNKKLNLYKIDLTKEEEGLIKLQQYLKSDDKNIGFIEKIKIRLKNIRIQKKVISEIHDDIDNLIRVHEKYLSGDSSGYNDHGLKLIDNKIKEIMDHINSTENQRSEMAVREDFLKMFSDEAGSQARKLEGRQGKHKGKK